MTATLFCHSEATALVIERALSTPITGQRPTRRTGQMVNRLLRKIDAELSANDLGTPISTKTLQLPLMERSPSVEPARDDHSRLQRVLAGAGLVQEVLDLTDARTAEVCGITRNTLASWRQSRRVPYPKSTRRLFEVESVVRVAVAAFGADGARQWFAELGGERIVLLETVNGPALIADALRSEIFETTHFSEVSVLELDEEADQEAVSGYFPDVFAATVADMELD